MCILLALVRARKVGASSQNVVSRTFPHFSQSMLTPMRRCLGFLAGVSSECVSLHTCLGLT